MPRPDHQPTLVGFNPYGNQNLLLPRPTGQQELEQHHLGVAKEWVQIDDWSESFFLIRLTDYWELSSSQSLLARAHARELPDDPAEVGELILTQLWCIRWPVAQALTGFSNPGILGRERWERIKRRYEQHLADEWPQERVDHVLKVKADMARAFWESKPGKHWVVRSRYKRDANWCVRNAPDCRINRCDDHSAWLLEFPTSDDYIRFMRSTKTRSQLPAWIEHPDGQIQPLGDARPREAANDQ